MTWYRVGMWMKGWMRGGTFAEWFWVATGRTSALWMQSVGNVLSVLTTFFNPVWRTASWRILLWPVLLCYAPCLHYSHMSSRLFGGKHLHHNLTLWFIVCLMGIWNHPKFDRRFIRFKCQYKTHSKYIGSIKTPHPLPKSVFLTVLHQLRITDKCWDILRLELWQGTGFAQCTQKRHDCTI